MKIWTISSGGRASQRCPSARGVQIEAHNIHPTLGKRHVVEHMSPSSALSPRSITWCEVEEAIIACAGIVVVDIASGAVAVDVHGASTSFVSDLNVLG